jgi:hypothetical protein
MDTPTLAQTGVDTNPHGLTGQHLEKNKAITEAAIDAKKTAVSPLTEVTESEKPVFPFNAADIRYGEGAAVIQAVVKAIDEKKVPPVDVAQAFFSYMVDNLAADAEPARYVLASMYEAEEPKAYFRNDQSNQTGKQQEVPWPETTTLLHTSKLHEDSSLIKWMDVVKPGASSTYPDGVDGEDPAYLAFDFARLVNDQGQKEVAAWMLRVIPHVPESNRKYYMDAMFNYIKELPLEEKIYGLIAQQMYQLRDQFTYSRYERMFHFI